jgi:PKHD-type hydroxylase
MNISRYQYWNNILSFGDINKINSIIKKYRKKEDRELKAKNTVKTSTVYQIKLKNFKEILDTALSAIVENNQDNYGYDIYNFSKEMFLNVNIYEKNQEYDWHNDSDPSNFSDLKLTVLINISEKKFTGGEFFLLGSKEPTSVPELNNPGSMVVFNSFVLHKVNPVLEGIRKTLTIFVKGPCFK